MPCGGIYPIRKHWSGSMFKSDDKTHTCMECNGPINPEVDLFCEEWDCYLHMNCVIEYLKGEEGKIVISHGHDVILRISDANMDDTIEIEDKNVTS